MILTDALAKTSMIFGNAMIMREIEVENKWDCCFWGARLRFARVWTGESTGDFPERDFGELGGAKGIRAQSDFPIESALIVNNPFGQAHSGGDAIWDGESALVESSSAMWLTRPDTDLPRFHCRSFVFFQPPRLSAIAMHASRNSSASARLQPGPPPFLL